MAHTEHAETKHIRGPLKFEPHNLHGTTVGGEPMPFGYISTETPMPIKNHGRVV